MLALICGTGALPAAIAGAQTDRPMVCALAGFPPAGLTPDLTFRMEHLGGLVAELRVRGVRDICFCGAVKRPEVDSAALDDATRPLVSRLLEAMEKGDDGALRALIAIFEEQGFAVRGAAELAPDLLPPAGSPTRLQPRPETHADVLIGIEALAEMSARDEGQACVVRSGRVEAREGPEGTDAMLRAYAARNLDGGILFKAPKPAQDRRADLPTIGPETAARAAAAGLHGVVIEAGGVLVLDLPEVVRRLDDAWLFLWVRAP
jgi:DUF1009 family protein